MAKRIADWLENQHITWADARNSKFSSANGDSYQMTGTKGPSSAATSRMALMALHYFIPKTPSMVIYFIPKIGYIKKLKKLIHWQKKMAGLRTANAIGNFNWYRSNTAFNMFHYFKRHFKTPLIFNLMPRTSSISLMTTVLV